MRWTDTHTHLNMLKEGVQAGVAEALAQNVHRMISIATQLTDFQEVLGIAEAHAPHVYCTLGVHPHDAKTYDEATENFLIQNLNHPRVVAVGEIGLDYHYNHSPQDVQKVVFKRQLEIAAKNNLPVEIHAREAEDDIISILKGFGGNIRGVIHCFSGTEKFARQALDLGFNLSISGIVTFKKSDILRDIVKKTDLSRLHVETDAPFLAPVPHRGRPNKPAFVPFVAEAISQIKNESFGKVSEVTESNTELLFTKILSIQP